MNGCKWFNGNLPNEYTKASNILKTITARGTHKLIKGFMHTTFYHFLRLKRAFKGAFMPFSSSLFTADQPVNTLTHSQISLLKTFKVFSAAIKVGDTESDDLTI